MKKHSKKLTDNLKRESSKTLERAATKLIKQADYYDKLREKKINTDFLKTFDDED